MRPLPLEHFASVMEPLTGERIAYVRPYGNVGDLLIEMATTQLFAEFGIRWFLYDPAAELPQDTDRIVYGGGGNMGTYYAENWALRERLARLGPPITILPQSFLGTEGRRFDRVYIRERASMAYYPGGELAPDLVLGLDWTPSQTPTKDVGVFLRRDREASVRRSWSHRRLNDAAELCSTPQDYLTMASQYRSIVTDRLHFALAGLVAGRHVTLLPNNYHKNKSLFMTWLKPLGMRFARTPEQALSALRKSKRPRSNGINRKSDAAMLAAARSPV